jgi:hypothetical protein
MNRHTSKIIASITFILFGIFEIMGLLMLLLPKEYLPKNFESQSLFWALISGLFGISRLIAGCAIWSNKKWGFVFGLMLCIATMIVAPTIIPFGIIDLVFTIIITTSLLYAIYGDEQAIK